MIIYHPLVIIIIYQYAWLMIVKQTLFIIPWLPECTILYVIVIAAINDKITIIATVKPLILTIDYVYTIDYPINHIIRLPFIVNGSPCIITHDMSH